MQWYEDIDSAHLERAKFGRTLLLMPGISLETETFNWLSFMFVTLKEVMYIKEL